MQEPSEEIPQGFFRCSSRAKVTIGCSSCFPKSSSSTVTSKIFASLGSRLMSGHVRLFSHFLSLRYCYHYRCTMPLPQATESNIIKSTVKGAAEATPLVNLYGLTSIYQHKQSQYPALRSRTTEGLLLLLLHNQVEANQCKTCNYQNNYVQNIPNIKCSCLRGES